jgi:hypothetical protein
MPSAVDGEGLQCVQPGNRAKLAVVEGKHNPFLGIMLISLDLR